MDKDSGYEIKKSPINESTYVVKRVFILAEDVHLAFVCIRAFTLHYFIRTTGRYNSSGYILTQYKDFTYA